MAVCASIPMCVYTYSVHLSVLFMCVHVSAYVHVCAAVCFYMLCMCVPVSVYTYACVYTCVYMMCLCMCVFHDRETS